MKNKKFTIGLAILIAGAVAFTGCTKNKTNPAPDPDKDASAATDASLAQITITDIGEIGAQACEGYGYMTAMFSATPMPTSIAWNGTTALVPSPMQAAVVVNTVAPFYNIVTFSNTVGRDGHVRNGTLKFDYSLTDPVTNAVYFRQPGLHVVVTATNYTVDKDTVKINSMTLMNTTPLGFPTVGNNVPSKVNMTWTQASDVVIKRADGKTITWNGTMTKTLLNTNNTSVPTASGSVTYTVYPSTPSYGSGLFWNKAYMSYTGNGSGSINGEAYTLQISTPLIRNMNTSPEAYLSLGGVLQSPELHPFLQGVMAIKPGTKSVRTIDFGSETRVDYDANVVIDGITYPVDVK
ncbi:MAG: hypothetical protein ACXVP0_05030 [Bacteroidia bacterium]